MELRIETQQTGHEILRELKLKWGTRKAILADDSPEARDALFWWDLLKEVGRLEEVHIRGKTFVMGPDDLRFLTPTRLELLRHVAQHDETLGQTARHLGRDLGNVKRDAIKLESVGLVRSTKKGRSVHLRPAGTRIVIDLL